jgi:acyl-CoA hydrolase
VTEHGVADLYGSNLRQRAMALIGIAHPAHREFLEREATARFHVLYD